jgi:GcrA cell cycle regulator
MPAKQWNVEKGEPMQTVWPPEQSDALREYLTKGMSYTEIAGAINARFNTDYSRNATIGRAKRMGLAGPARPDHWPSRPQHAGASRLHEARERHVPELIRPTPAFKRTRPVKLRCVSIAPRQLSLLDLQPGDCRYPYGGNEEGEAITFCGHPCREGFSYCAPHFRLTREPGTAPERRPGRVVLRLVEAA